MVLIGGFNDSLGSWSFSTTNASLGMSYSTDKTEGTKSLLFSKTGPPWAAVGDYCEVTLSMDFTGINTIYWDWRTGDFTDMYFQVYVDTTKEFEYTLNQGTWQYDETINVSSYSGTHTLKFRFYVNFDASITKYLYIDNIRDDVPYTEVLTENINLADSFIPLRVSELTENLNYTDSIFKLTLLTESESISLTESRNLESFKVLSDSITLLESFQQLIETIKTESLSLTDPAIDILRIKTLNEAIIIADTLSSLIDKVMIGSLFLTDTVPRELFKPVSDSINLTASMERLRILPDMNESIGLSDTNLNKSILTRTESISLTDLGIVPGIQKALIEIINLTDSIKKEIEVEYSEQINLSDTKENLLIKELNETINLADSLFKLMTKYLSNSITLSSVLTHFTTKNLTESVTLTDLGFNWQIQKLITETLTLLDTLVFNLTRTFTEIMQLSDLDEGIREVSWLFSALTTEPDIYVGDKVNQ